MSRELVECDHCKGNKNCMASGGRSCRVCLDAAGVGRRGWATVRCSYCGGRGKVWVEEEEEAQEPEGEQEQAADEEPEGEGD